MESFLKVPLGDSILDDADSGSSFTDEELKVLKDDLARMPNIDVCNYFETDQEILALVARLEAAEVLAAYGAVIRGPDSPAVKAWRKVSGK